VRIVSSRQHRLTSTPEALKARTAMTGRNESLVAVRPWPWLQCVGGYVENHCYFVCSKKLVSHNSYLRGSMADGKEKA
jgi:hypothetical protein